MCKLNCSDAAPDASRLKRFEPNRHYFHTEVVMKRTIFAVLAVFTITLAIHAQERADARNKVSEALAKGDTATAVKLLTEISAGVKSSASAVPLWNTSFEEIRACGFYPQETRLECVLDIKQPGGYGGPIGSIGSFEYVSFFVDWANDGFQITDYVGSGIVNVVDGSAKTNFAVYRDFNPPGGPRTSNSGATTTTTTGGPTFRALAKLSWAIPSITPGAPVAWGNELGFTIRMNPIR
jgi:hypothetical protein